MPQVDPMYEIPAVVLPGDANSLVVIWGLADAGIPAIALVHDGNCPQRWSRHPMQRIHVGSDAHGDLLDGLARVAGEGAVLIPTADRDVAFMSEHRSLLEERFRFILPRPDLVGMVLDKSAEIRRMGELGVPMPRSVPVLPATPEELVSALGPPMIIKPRSFGHRSGERRTFRGRVARNCQIGPPLPSNRSERPLRGRFALR